MAVPRSNTARFGEDHPSDALQASPGWTPPIGVYDGGWPVARVAMHHRHIKERALRDDTDADFELGVSLASLSSARAAAGAAPRASTPPDPWDPRSLTPPVPTELEAAPTSANGAPYSYEDPIPLPPQHRRQMGTRGPVLVMMNPVPTRKTERPRTADAADILLREIEETQAVEAELAALEAREQATKEESQLLREIEETHAVEAALAAMEAERQQRLAEEEEAKRADAQALRRAEAVRQAMLRSQPTCDGADEGFNEGPERGEAATSESEEVMVVAAEDVWFPRPPGRPPKATSGSGCKVWNGHLGAYEEPGDAETAAAKAEEEGVECSQGSRRAMLNLASPGKRFVRGMRPSSGEAASLHMLWSGVDKGGHQDDFGVESSGTVPRGAGCEGLDDGSSGSGWPKSVGAKLAKLVADAQPRAMRSGEDGRQRTGLRPPTAPAANYKNDLQLALALSASEFLTAHGSQHEQAGHEQSGHEQSGHEQSGHEQAGHEQSGHDRGTKRTHASGPSGEVRRGHTCKGARTLVHAAASGGSHGGLAAAMEARPAGGQGNEGASEPTRSAIIATAPEIVGAGQRHGNDGESDGGHQDVKEEDEEGNPSRRALMAMINRVPKHTMFADTERERMGEF